MTEKMVKVRAVAVSFSDLKPGDHVCWGMKDLLGLQHHEIVTMVLSSRKAFESVGFTRNQAGFCSIHENLRNFAEVLKEAVDKKVYRIDYLIEDPNINYFNDEEVVERAKLTYHGVQKDANKSYNMLHNNCEHFATWCKIGLAISFQAEKFKTMASFTSAAILASSLTGPFGLALAAGIAASGSSSLSLSGFPQSSS